MSIGAKTPNAEHKSTVCVYSLRAEGQKPFVSIPLAWQEFRRAIDVADPRRFCIKPDEALKRAQSRDDLFERVLRLKQNLPAKLADRMRSAKRKELLPL